MQFIEGSPESSQVAAWKKVDNVTREQIFKDILEGATGRIVARPQHPRAEFKLAKDGEKVEDKVQMKMSDFVSNPDSYSDRVPNSTVRTFGAEIREDDGKLIWDNTSLRAKFDYWGDNILRALDEHISKDPLAVTGNIIRNGHFSWLLRFTYFNPNSTRRYRGTTEEVLKNAHRLGLDDIYGPSGKAVEIKRPEMFREGVNLSDIFRTDLIPGNTIANLDRFEASASAAKYIRTIHDRANGGVGELLSNDIIFEDGDLTKPFLNVPDICWNETKEIGIVDQKATDLVEFLISNTIEESRRSAGDVESLNKVADTIIENYGDDKVIKIAISLLRRGRFLFNGDKDFRTYDVMLGKTEMPDLPNTIATRTRKFTGLHNSARFYNIEGEKAVNIKSLVIERCQRYIDSKKAADKAAA